MQKRKTRRVVDELDIMAAISDLQAHMRKKNISHKDLAIQLGWTVSMVGDILNGIDLPKYEDIEAIAEVLNQKLEF